MRITEYQKINLEDYGLSLCINVFFIRIDPVFFPYAARHFERNQKFFMAK